MTTSNHLFRYLPDDLTVRLCEVEAYGEKHLLPVGTAGFADTFVCGSPRPSPALVTAVTLRPSDGQIDWFGDEWCPSCSELVGALPLEVRYIVPPEEGESYSVVLP
jgi:hypothetical protein